MNRLALAAILLLASHLGFGQSFELQDLERLTQQIRPRVEALFGRSFNRLPTLRVGTLDEFDAEMKMLLLDRFPSLKPPANADSGNAENGKAVAVYGALDHSIWVFPDHFQSAIPADYLERPDGTTDFLKLVLAHEMVHALQEEKHPTDLSKFLQPGFADNSDRKFMRMALREGQAFWVMEVLTDEWDLPTADFLQLNLDSPEIEALRGDEEEYQRARLAGTRFFRELYASDPGQIWSPFEQDLQDLEILAHPELWLDPSYPKIPLFDLGDELEGVGEIGGRRLQFLLERADEIPPLQLKDRTIQLERRSVLGISASLNNASIAQAQVSLFASDADAADFLQATFEAIKLRASKTELAPQADGTLDCRSYLLRLSKGPITTDLYFSHSGRRILVYGPTSQSATGEQGIDRILKVIWKYIGRI